MGTYSKIIHFIKTKDMFACIVCFCTHSCEICSDEFQTTTTPDKIQIVDVKTELRVITRLLHLYLIQFQGLTNTKAEVWPVST